MIISAATAIFFDFDESTPKKNATTDLDGYIAKNIHGLREKLDSVCVAEV
jgi:hypothetical protein